jgi:hypothetical protein
MPSIEVDLVFFIFNTIISFLALPFMIGIVVWKSYKNPEFWLRVRKQDWVYILIRNPMLKLVQIALPLSRIGENGEFTIFKNRKYYWKEKYFKEQEKDKDGKQIGQPDPKNGLPTVFGWRNKKMGALYDWNDPFPQTWAPSNSLTSMTDPKTLRDMQDMKILQLLMNADSITSLMRFSLIISLIVALAVAGLAFEIFSYQASVDHLLRIVGNFTRGTP